MSVNVELLYKRAFQFQNERSEIVKEYETKCKELQQYYGSQAYEEKYKEVHETHEKALKSLQDEARNDINRILNGMTEKVSNRMIKPPTEEQLRIVEGLRMIENPSLEMINRAAASCAGSPIALQALSEMAKKKHGVIANFWRINGEMDSRTAEDVLKGLQVQLKDFIESDESRAGRLAGKYMRDLYGYNVERIAKRQEFHTMQEFYQMFVGLDQEGLKMFSEIVDS